MTPPWEGPADFSGPRPEPFPASAHTYSFRDGTTRHPGMKPEGTPRRNRKQERRARERNHKPRDRSWTPQDTPPPGHRPLGSDGCREALEGLLDAYERLVGGLGDGAFREHVEEMFGGRPEEARKVLKRR